ncbi:MAG: polysaccharide deacetylase family protein [Desulforhopalus sp.]
MTTKQNVRYSALLPGVKQRLSRAVDKGCSSSVKTPLLFFRADDIGIPSAKFSRLISCFLRHRLPLCLATVPAWVNGKRLTALRRITGPDSSQWCWHQHGRLHRNFEESGKKQEFGPSRPKEVIRTHLQKGRNRLEEILDTNFTPVFTPPWNRCSSDTLETLADLQFSAVSRFLNAMPPAPDDLPEFPVNVDLHTRREPTPQQSFDNLLREIEQALASGFCGVMIHHQKMNRKDFHFLDLLLDIMQSRGKTAPVDFRDLIG